MAVLAATAEARAPALATSLVRSLAAQGVSPSRTAALVVDLRSGEVVLSRNASLPLVPASNVKLAVGFAALSALGPAYRFRTWVLGTGRLLEDGTWTGDLWLRGFGDPTLDAAGIASLARHVRAAGIRSVRGAVLGDDSWFDAERAGRGWKPWFLGQETPPVGALVVERARGWPSRPAAALAAARLHEALAAAGVAVAKAPRGGVAPPAALPLVQHLSPRLGGIVRFMNRESDNFTAEMLLKTLGAETAGRGTAAAGAAAVRAELARAGVPLAGVRLVDGSGLSRHDRLTASALVAIVRAAIALPALADVFTSSLAVAGVDGTLQDRMARAPTYGQVIGKTGTTSLASTLAGMVRGRYAFAILMNGSPVPTWSARAAQDRFLTLLAGAG